MNFLPTLPLTLTPLMAFGLILVIGALGGFLAHRLHWLPSITGFMLVGFICGPSGLGVLGPEVMAGARIFVDIALVLILYRLGLSLDLKAIANSHRLLATSLLESALTFLGVLMVLLYAQVPATVAALVATIAISSSPAVLLHVANELGARGPVTDDAKSLVALNNLLAFLTFSVAVAGLRLAEGSISVAILALEPVYQLLGSLVIGVAFGQLLHFLATRTATAQQYRLAVVIGVLILATALAQELKLSQMFTALVMGVFIRTVEREDPISNLEFGQPFELFFILLFVYAGASLHLHELVVLLPAVGGLAVVRIVAKLIGPLLAGRAFHNPARVSFASGMLMLPMAGLAIGLTYKAASLFPDYAATISAIVLGAVTVFETLGPPVAAFAFRFAGEVGAAETQEEEAEKGPE